MLQLLASPCPGAGDRSLPPWISLLLSPQGSWVIKTDTGVLRMEWEPRQHHCREMAPEKRCENKIQEHRLLPLQ